MDAIFEPLPGHIKESPEWMTWSYHILAAQIWGLDCLNPYPTWCSILPPNNFVMLNNFKAIPLEGKRSYFRVKLITSFFESMLNNTSSELIFAFFKIFFLSQIMHLKLNILSWTLSWNNSLEAKYTCLNFFLK